MRSTYAISILLAAASFNIPLAAAFSAGKSNGNPFSIFSNSIGQKLNIPFIQAPPVEEEVKRPKTVEDVVKLTASREPKTFQVSKGVAADLALSSFVAILRLGSGIFSEGYHLSIGEKDESKYSVFRLGNYQIEETCSTNITAKARPPPITIYEFEGCPFCRKVREAVSILSLKVLYKPCPKDGLTFRREYKEKYGKRATFPHMVDPNTGIEMSESDDIIKYLFTAYGDGVVPDSLQGIGAPLTAGIGLLTRLGKGSSAKPSNPPDDPLVLWSYEGSPFCKIVREELCELEIPHIQISCPRGSPNRQKMYDQVGRFQVPYLEDPNEGVALFESEAIIEYIQKRYGIATPAMKYM